MNGLPDAFAPGLASLAMVAAIVFVAGVLRGLTGFGFAIVAAPLLAVVLPPGAAVGACVLLQLGVGLLEAPRAWATARGQPLTALVAGTLVATPLGAFILSMTPAAAQRLMIAAAAIVALAAVWRGRERPIAAIVRHPLRVGLASGVLNGLAAMPGPPVVTYFLTAPISEAEARAALSVYFAFAAVIATGSGLMAGVIDASTALPVLSSLPGLIAGTRLGGALFARGHPGLYRQVGMAALALAAAAAIARALADLDLIPA